MSERDIFIAALQQEGPAQRQAYLDQACAGRPELRDQVEHLLRLHQGAGSFLERPAAATPATGPAQRGDEQASWREAPGALIGPYKLIEPIGEGGMGSVWMAQQQEPVKRLVALKLIKAGMDSKQVIARFEAERQALALMDHANIARVLEAGTTGASRPYFVMDLVKGLPITRYCDEHHLTPRQRLGLFVPVCQAVQHAHQKGIIHRDLKPSNVLVALYDGQPVPKVIDFGVAKATGQQLTEKTLVTGLGTIVGTLEHLSPEQAEINQLDIDTRSDLYSLGVLLYELLTGSPPFTRAELEQSGGMLEMLRVIREQEPTKPSAKLSTAEGLPTLAANRGTEPAKLTRLVRGELDWIVMKALEKDRNRRYETANAFAIDVQRYLADEPVQACPPSASYRLRKFVRRNKGRVVAAIGLAVSLLAGIAAVTAVQARANRDRAAREASTITNITAAVREARARADEAWRLSEYPNRMQLATDAAVAGVVSADNFARGGSPPESTLAELAAARQEVDELARHTRLICASDRNRQRRLDESTFQSMFTQKANTNFCSRQGEALRELGLNPLDRSVDEVARTVAASRIRDSLLGMLLEWHELVPVKPKGDPRAAVIKDRLGQVIRSTRQLCGGPYARWQDLLDRKDVPGLVAFASHPDGLRFEGLVGALARDLGRTGQGPAFRNFLRAASDRYPHDVWLHVQMYLPWPRMQPPDYAEALRHASAASVQRPDNAALHFTVGTLYSHLGAHDQAVAAYRKSIALSPDNYPAHAWLGAALWQMKDRDGALAAYRKALRIWPDERPPRALRGLVSGLMIADRHAEALQELLAAFRRGPALAKQPWVYFRYDAACAANNCADGKGVGPPPPAERPAYRKQALDFLTAELAAFQKLAVRDRTFTHERMRWWLADRDLASVRDPLAVEALPPDQREAWKKLWAQVRDLRDRTAPQPGSPKSAK